MARMRVALVNRLAGIHRGGGEVYDLSLAAALRRLGVDVEIVTGRPSLRKPPAPVVEVSSLYARSPYLRAAAHRLGRAGWRLFDLDLRLFERAAYGRIAAARPPFDLVQVTGLPRLARRIEVEGRTPVVLLFPGPPSIRHREEVRACRTVVGVGAVTPYLKENFREDVHDMTAGVETSLFRPDAPSARADLGIDDGALVVIYAGRLVPLKNLPLLVEAFAGIRREIPAARLLVVGGGPLRGELHAEARRAGLSVGRRGDEGCAIVDAGEAPHVRMPSFYTAADLLLLSSLNESFSLVALEAMACGVCVLVPAVGYLPRLVADGVSGVLYPAGDARALVAAAVSVLNDPGRRRRIGAEARRAALERHSWDAVAAEFAALYRKVLGR